MNKLHKINITQCLKESNDVDLAKAMLYTGHITHPTYRHNQFYIIAVTIANSLSWNSKNLPSSLVKQFSCIENLDYAISCSRV